MFDEVSLISPELILIPVWLAEFLYVLSISYPTTIKMITNWPASYYKERGLNFRAFFIGKIYIKAEPFLLL